MIYKSAPLRGWAEVQKAVADAQEHLRLARTPSEFAAVGTACAQVILLLLHAAYVLSRNLSQPLKIQLSASPLRLLENYIAQALPEPDKGAVLANLAVVERHYEASDMQGARRCVAATAAVVEYLAPASDSISGPRETVADLCERFLRERSNLGKSQEYATRKLQRMPIGKIIAAQLTPEDVIEHVRKRRNEVAAATVIQDITYLRGVLVAARESWNLDISLEPIEEAKRQLWRSGDIGRSNPRSRRPTREELQSLVDYFEDYEKDKRNKIPMRDIMEFALWSARRIGEICELEWDDLDEKKENCKVRVTDARGNVRVHEFPLLGQARNIVLRQRREDSPKIFPYNSKSASAAYRMAIRRLKIENLTFQDLRREAAIRLYEAGHSVEQISKVTGRKDLNTLLRDIGARPAPASEKKESGTEVSAKPRRALELD